MDRYWVLFAVSWLAVIAGFVGTWLAGRHRSGWLVGLGCCLLWSVYDVAMSIWAGLFAAVVGCVLNVRNYWIGRHAHAAVDLDRCAACPRDHRGS